MAALSKNKKLAPAVKVSHRKSKVHKGKVAEPGHIFVEILNCGTVVQAFEVPSEILEYQITILKQLVKNELMKEVLDATAKASTT